MKFIVGPFRFKPGLRDESLRTLQPFVDEVRREPGCIFFEFNPKIDDPDVAFLCECFTDDASHAQHKTLPHMVALFAELGRTLESADTKVHYADKLFDDV